MSATSCPGDVETVIRQDAPQAIYRNPFLADAMVELNLIDTQGGGIKRMFETQRRRWFPLPDYDLSRTGPGDGERSRGRILDERYTRLLMERTDLDLGQVMLLDRVQKGQRIGRDEHRRLKAAGLVEGRYPEPDRGGRGREGGRRGGPTHPRAGLRQAVLPGPHPGAGARAPAGGPEGRGSAAAHQAAGSPHAESRSSAKFTTSCRSCADLGKLIDNRGTSRRNPQWVTVRSASVDVKDSLMTWQRSSGPGNGAARRWLVV